MGGVVLAEVGIGRKRRGKHEGGMGEGRGKGGRGYGNGYLTACSTRILCL